jgi:hypothetical protein
MAPRTKLPRCIPVSSIVLKAGFCLLLLVFSAFFPYSISAAPLANAATLPNLPSFALKIENGDGSVLRGVYAGGLFALPIVQQPRSNAVFVSSIDNTLTQFRMAGLFGNVGLLAHIYFGGQYFSLLYPGMRLQLVYGDGRIESFQVTHVYRYQAISPRSVTSDFVDLDTQEYLTSSALFTKVYKGPRHVTFQTCIYNDGDSGWGRLFVIAEPLQDVFGVNHINNSRIPSIFSLRPSI